MTEVSSLAKLGNAVRKSIRTLGQLIIAGGLTGIVDLITHGLSAESAAVVLAVWQVIVTYVHNALEDHGVVPTLLRNPTPATQQEGS